MAALRYAARRLALRRPQAAGFSSTLAKEQGGILPGLFHTSDLTVEQKKDVASRLVQIEAKKEELYSLASDLQRNYKIPGKIGQQNGQLTHHLAVLVKPKPNDPYWRVHSRAYRIMDCMQFMGLCCLGPVVVISLTSLMKVAYGKVEGDSRGETSKSSEVCLT